MKNTRLSKHLASPSEAAISHSSELDGLHLSPHFTLDEFLNVGKYPDNEPSLQHVANMTYGCLMLLEPTPPCRRLISSISESCQVWSRNC